MEKGKEYIVGSGNMPEKYKEMLVSVEEYLKGVEPCEKIEVALNGLFDLRYIRECQFCKKVFDFNLKDAKKETYLKPIRSYEVEKDSLFCFRNNLDFKKHEEHRYYTLLVIECPFCGKTNEIDMMGEHK